jgi:hypothetical protein
LRLRDILIYALAGAVLLPAQQALPAQAAKMVDQQPKGTLKINVLEGEGMRNSIRNRSAVAPVVEVKDAADKAVVGAEVVFQLPLAGPGGIFNGWLRSQTVRTDENGKATVTGYTPNTEAGRYNIKVTATSGSQSGSAVIAQINVENGEAAMSGAATGGKTPPTGMKKSLPWKIIGPVLGAVAIGGVAAGLRGGKTTTAAAASTPVSISAGAVSVGVPR